MISKTFVFLGINMLVMTAMSRVTVTRLDRHLTCSSPHTCRSCVNNSSQRWCVVNGTANPTVGECCNSGDTSGYCSDNSSYVCSNSKDIDNNGGLILCPTEASHCGERDVLLEWSKDYENITQALIPHSSLCVYRIHTTSSLVKSLEIEINDFSGADVKPSFYTIFTGSRDKNKYSHKGSMKANDKKRVAFYEDSCVYIVVEPSSGYNRLSIGVKASTAQVVERSTAEFIVLIVVIGVLGVVLLIGVGLFFVLIAAGCFKCIRSVILCCKKSAEDNTSPQGVDQEMAPAKPYAAHPSSVVHPQIAVPAPPDANGPQPIEGNRMTPAGSIHTAEHIG
ncbi:unnamed protein product [Moneuplotes crassus]|uniref:CUB domain-containing protein n=1 Tax=Euplotes crassus TaxID=5936 RepID=A0AAD1XCP5_EUPCR|nr:unnamed protein product [Moneuplotes crassus]